jgi:plasmid stabilization system protein ParE
MTVRWSPEAAADFAAIVEYIRNQNPSMGATSYAVARVLKYVAAAWL